MKRRNECMENLRQSAREQMEQDFNKSNPKYVETLKKLIVQGMIKLLEEEVEIKVREDEVSLVQDMLDDCQSQYSEIMMRETQREYKTTLSVMEDKFLTNDDGGRCGGVVLYAHKRRIVCQNTLEDRLNLVFEQELP